MKNQWFRAGGILCYLAIITLLLDFDWLMLFKPRPFYSVILGMFILTASQYKKGYTREDMAAGLRWNLIFASFLTTLMSILTCTSSGGLDDMPLGQLSGALLPMLYGSIMYLVLGIVFNDSFKRKTTSHINITEENLSDLPVPFSTEQVFRDLGLTDRECHIALKLLENTPNKVTAAQLYISESTVKKHIQNIYQKVGASDRSSFREICFKAAKASK